jgi:hypothetical protein
MRKNENKSPRIKGEVQVEEVHSNMGSPDCKRRFDTVWAIRRRFKPPCCSMDLAEIPELRSRVQAPLYNETIPSS